MLKNKEPIALMLLNLESLAKRINVLVRKLDVMGLQPDEQKEYYESVGKYSSMRLILADRIFDKELLPIIRTDDAYDLSNLLRSQIGWDTSLLMDDGDIDKVSYLYENHGDKALINKTINNYFIILTDNLMELFDDIEEKTDEDMKESILNMGKLLNVYDKDISLFKAKKLIHDHLLYKFETIYMILEEVDKH